MQPLHPTFESSVKVLLTSKPMIDHSLPDWNVRRTKFRQFPQRRLFIALGYFAGGGDTDGAHKTSSQRLLSRHLCLVRISHQPHRNARRCKQNESTTCTR